MRQRSARSEACAVFFVVVVLLPSPSLNPLGNRKLTLTCLSSVQRHLPVGHETIALGLFPPVSFMLSRSHCLALRFQFFGEHSFLRVFFLRKLTSTGPKNQPRNLSHSFLSLSTQYPTCGSVCATENVNSHTNTKKSFSISISNHRI